MNTVDQEDQGDPPPPLVTSLPLFRDLPASAALEAWYET